MRSGSAIIAAVIMILTNAYLTPVASAGLVCQAYKYAPNVVMTAQRELNQHKMAKLKVDGVWGYRTQEALKRFQEYKGLKQTGDLDAETFHAMFGPNVLYEGVTVVQNPNNAPMDIYIRECR
jgi:murein L,D-transpeptidase YcbB/YkuD